jgi:transcriptional regulator with XRE-family HTH domain
MAEAQVLYPTISSVLSYLIREAGISESELANQINIRRATINRIRSGKITDPKSSTLTAIAKYFNVSVDQLLGYTPLIKTNHRSHSSIQVPVLKWEDMHAPALSSAIKANDYTTFEIEINREPDVNSNSLVAVKVNSCEAMWPYFGEESIIIVDYSIQPKNKNFVLAYISETNEVILRQILIDGKSKVLSPLHSDFSSREMKKEDKIIGVVIHVKRDLW